MPKKHLGQHFLSDPNILERIVDFSRVSGTDTVLEVGPGRGALTATLADRVSRVIAVEVDCELAARLRESMPENVSIIEGDALKIDFASIASGPYHVVANLPYNIATPLIERFLGARRHIRAVTVMIQKEVADRICASPGTRDFGPLSVGVQYYAKVERGFLVPPGAFSPKPKVDSRMVRLSWPSQVADAPMLMDFVRKSFISRRKKLLNNLAPLFPQLRRTTLAGMLERAGVSPDARPEQLSIEQFRVLYETLSRKT